MSFRIGFSHAFAIAFWSMCKRCCSFIHSSGAHGVSGAATSSFILCIASVGASSGTVRGCSVWMEAIEAPSVVILYYMHRVSIGFAVAHQTVGCFWEKCKWKSGSRSPQIHTSDAAATLAWPWPPIALRQQSIAVAMIIHSAWGWIQNWDGGFFN